MLSKYIQIWLPQSHTVWPACSLAEFTCKRKDLQPHWRLPWRLRWIELRCAYKNSARFRSKNFLFQHPVTTHSSVLLGPACHQRRYVIVSRTAWVPIPEMKSPARSKDSLHAQPITIEVSGMKVYITSIPIIQLVGCHIALIRHINDPYHQLLWKLNANSKAVTPPPSYTTTQSTNLLIQDMKALLLMSTTSRIMHMMT